MADRRRTRLGADAGKWRVTLTLISVWHCVRFRYTHNNPIPACALQNIAKRAAKKWLACWQDTDKFCGDSDGLDLRFCSREKPA